MKTTIIQLEPHDDLVSVRDKMAWAKTERILLAFPRRRQPNIRPLDMVLLQRHAASLGAQLGIATRNADLRRAAESAGISTYRTTTEAQRATWSPAPAIKLRRHKRRKAASLRQALSSLRKTEQPGWLKHRAVRAGIFLAGLLATLGLISIFVPSARIELKPETQHQTITVNVKATPDTTSTTIAGDIPLREITIEVQGNGSLPASGRLSIPGEQAKGVARFTNPGQNPVTIPQGTIVKTLDSPSVSFYTTQAGTAPPNGSIDLPIRAINGGTESNVPAGKIAQVTGELQFSLTVTNPEETSGGTDVSQPAPSEPDRARLFNQIQKTLAAQAFEQAAQALPVGAILVPASQTLKETLIENFDPPPGINGQILTLSLKQTYTVQYLSADDLATLGKLALNSTLPEEFIGVENVTATAIGNPTRSANGALRWEIQFERLISRQISIEQVFALAHGKTIAGARVALEALPLDSPPRIIPNPAWWPLLPLIPARLSVEFGG